ncbi:sodium-dependent transporter [Endozoicomonas sp. ONNA1]|uniref:sodium-dependent transporter n=1 Tax=Endozoicomonas sp. ONNA1 TaxID=2828740 RepID=UPI0021475006|nr:sodium-dependent transporter [Endozoicomonas sp. ONNA1]
MSDHNRSTLPQACNNIQATRGQFSSRLGFIIAAAGCAVGVGNIWSFPTQTAQNGGAAFVLVYLCFSFILAYPTLVAELTIGRYSQSNSVTAMTNLDNRNWVRALGFITSIMGLLTLTLIYSFYSIVGGWFTGFSLAPIFELSGLHAVATWLTDFNIYSTVLVTLMFMALTTLIVNGGVKEGIERWCNRLMPALFIILSVLIVFALSRPGGMEGLKVYLIPDFSKLLNQQLLISALGQSFFSMSLGVGCMMVYGSYLSKKANLPLTAFQVALVDSSVAFLAGMLIIPCMYAAMQQGIEIYTAQGQLHSADTLVFNVLPTLFNQLGVSGQLVALAFFVLLTIAALTSSISLTEPTVAFMVEKLSFQRHRASWCITVISACLSVLIIYHIETLLGLTVKIATQYLQPLLCLIIAIYGSWIMRQNRLLKALSQGFPEIRKSLFWKIWPWYIRTICPGLILIIFLSNL